MANNIDPKYGASGAQLSASTRRAMARRRKLANTGPKIANPMVRIPNVKPLPYEAPTAPTESVPRLDGTFDNAPMSNTISRGVAGKLPTGTIIGNRGPGINRLGSAQTTPTAPVDAKFGININKPTKKKAMGKVEEANYGMSKAMDRGVRKALRMPPA